MKKILLRAVLLIMSIAVLSFGGITAFAAVYPEDNFGAYIVATGDIGGGDGMTYYYTTVGDGNAIVYFDLLHLNSVGNFGFICCDKDKLGSLSQMSDHALFGQTNKATLDLSGDFNFKTGYSYKITVNARQKKITLEEAKTGESDHALIFEADMTAEKTTAIGLAAVSDGTNSCTAIIDNLKITDLKGTVYVSNTFDGGATVKDGSMKILSANPETGAKLTGGVGNVFLHKDLMLSVRFMSEGGEIISEQKVCMYGSATAPEAPRKEGYEFVGWNKSVYGIEKDEVFYPLYKEEGEVESASSSEDVSESEGESERESSSAKPASDNGGCGGEMAAPAVLSALLGAAFIAFRKRRA